MTLPTYSVQTPTGLDWSDIKVKLHSNFAYATVDWILIYEGPVKRDSLVTGTKYIVLSRDRAIADRTMMTRMLEERLFINAAREAWIIRYVPTEDERGEFQTVYNMKKTLNLTLYLQLFFARKGQTLRHGKISSPTTVEQKLKQDSEPQLWLYRSASLLTFLTTCRNIAVMSEYHQNELNYPLKRCGCDFVGSGKSFSSPLCL